VLPGASASPPLLTACLQVVDPDTGGEKLDDIRTSFGTFLARGETDIIRQVELRVAEWAQVPEENAEQLQILRYAPAASWAGLRVSLRPLTLYRKCSYGIGQQYNDHWDWFDAKTLQARITHVQQDRGCVR